MSTTQMCDNLYIIQYYDNSIKRATVVLTVDQNMDKKLKA